MAHTATTPRRVRAAIVRDIAYDLQGRLVRGMSHFAPGSLVYVAGPYSGDGYARTMMIGRDRDTARYVALMGSTARLKQWHLADVTEPDALRAIHHAAGDWDYRFSYPLDLPTAPPPIAWQPHDAWRQLVARWLEPDRPQLAACAAAILGCTLDEAHASLARGNLGAQLVAAQKGRAPAAVRSSAAAWRALAPASWQVDATARAFARSDLAGPATATTPTRPVPGNMHAVVALCSGPASVEAAEVLARQLIAALHPAPPPAIVWHFVRHNEIAAHLQPTRVTAPSTSLPLDALRALMLAISRDDDQAAQPLADALRADAASAGCPDPVAPLVALLASGHALLDLTPTTAHLACPLFPASRPPAAR